MNLTKALVLLSGGLDSAACVAYFRGRGLPTTGFFVDYGQRAASRESRAAADVASHYQIPLETIRVVGFSEGVSGRIPGRNAFLVRAAAFNKEATPLLIGIGIHAGTGFPDCSPEFATRMDAELRTESGGLVRLAAPFVQWTKRDIWDYATRERLPIEKTYSCQEGSEPVCGRCKSCLDREALLAPA